MQKGLRRNSGGLFVFGYNRSMGVINKKSLSIIIAVILSVTLHIIVIAGIAGMDFFNLKELFSTKPFHAKIVSETLHKSKLNKPPQKTSPSDLPHKEKIPLGEKSEMSSEKPLVSHKQEQTDTITEQQTSKLIEKEEQIEIVHSQNTFQILKSAKEKLHFDIYWLGVYVGKAVLEAVNDNGNVKITSQVHSAPVISAFYKVEDYAESRVTNGMPALFKIKQRAGRKRSDKETFFDINNKKVTHINHIKGTKDEHVINAENLWDVMSGFYYLRTQELNVGETVYINIFDSNKFYKAEVQILRKDKIKLTDEKEVDAVVVKPVLKSEGLFENKGNITVWLSDDDMRVPLRLETEVSIGRVVAELKTMETEKEK